MMNNNLLIIGAGQYGQVAKEIAEAMNCFDKIDFLDDNSDIAVGKIPDMEKLTGDYSYAIIAIGDPDLRRRLTDRLEECGYKISVLVHPKSYVSPSANLMKGCIVEPMAVIQAGSTLGKGVLVSAGSIVNHNCFICDFCHLDTGSIVKSNSVLKMNTKLEAGQIFSGVDDLKTGDNSGWINEHIAKYGIEPNLFDGS